MPAPTSVSLNDKLTVELIYESTYTVKDLIKDWSQKETSALFSHDDEALEALDDEACRRAVEDQEVSEIVIYVKPGGLNADHN